MRGAESSILILAKACITKFDRIIAQHGPGQIDLENRLADFNLWADGVDALSSSRVSLDSRLQGHGCDLDLVKSILTMLADSLDYYRVATETEASTEASTDECIRNLDSVMSNLALISAAIRRAGKASRSRAADRTFNPDSYPDFRRHLECIVLLRPTEEAHFHLTETGNYVTRLDSSKLTPLQNRLVDATLRRRHNFNIAQQRSKHQKGAYSQLSPPKVGVSAGSFQQGRVPSGLQDASNAQSPREHLTANNSGCSASTISKFSMTPTTERTLQYGLIGKKNSSGVAKTQITSIAFNVQFPQPPPIPSGRRVAKCPCCCQFLPVETFTNPKIWEQHVIEDLCPYTCIAERCPTPDRLFCTKREWKNHVKQRHLPQLKCPFCDEQDGDYPTRESIEKHFQSEHTHELQRYHLAEVLSLSEVQTTMGITMCPLCTSSGPEDSPELIDHVLQHTYEFALRALPWPPPPIQELNTLPGGFNVSDSSKHLQNIPQWINEAPHEEVEIAGLNLTDFDKADHSTLAPTNTSEYTDHFLVNSYFADGPEDTSSRPQSCYSVHSLHSSSINSDTMLAWTATTEVVLSTLKGHTSSILSVAFSPDSKTVISGSWDETMRLWSVDTGAHLQTFEGHTGTVMSVAFSPDGKTIVSGSFDETIGLWSADTGAYLQILEGHARPVNSVAFSPNGEIIASGSVDQTIRLWLADSGTHLRTLKGHTDSVNSVAFSPDGNTIVSGSDDHTIQIWSADTGAHLRTLAGHRYNVVSVLFSPDGKLIVSGSWDGTIQVWSADTGACLQKIEVGSRGVDSIAISPDGKTLVSGSDKTIRLWATDSWTHLQTLESHRHSIEAITISPDGNTIASVSFDRKVRLFRHKDSIEVDSVLSGETHDRKGLFSSLLSLIQYYTD